MNAAPESSEDAKPERWSADFDGDEVCFTRTLDHAKLAYANMQEVIRFVDLKSNVLIALSTVVSGAALAMAKWNLELPRDSSLKFQVLLSTHPYLAWTAAALFTISLIGTVVSCVAACWSMIARPAAPGYFTLLYPVPRDMKRADHERRVSECLAGMSRAAVLHDFREQLPAVGRIAQVKQKCSRIAAITVIAQLVFLTVAVLVYVFLAASS